MQNDRKAISKFAALKMYFDAGFKGEKLIKEALHSLRRLGDCQPKKSYFYADDVEIIIANDIELHGIKK
jgi:hypothetical protein